MEDQLSCKDSNLFMFRAFIAGRRGAVAAGGVIESGLPSAACLETPQPSPCHFHSDTRTEALSSPLPPVLLLTRIDVISQRVANSSTSVFMLIACLFTLWLLGSVSAHSHVFPF